MKILLINYGKQGADLHFPLSLAYIASALKKADIDFDILDCYLYEFEEHEKIIYNKLKENSYDLIGISTFLGNYSYRDLKKVVNEIKKEFPKIKIIFGGPMATCIPEMILKYMSVDIVVIGEGEETIVELINCLDSKKDLNFVNGIAFKSNNKIIITKTRLRIINLDYYHPLPYNLFPIEYYINYLKKTNRAFGLLGSRGCYSNCNFCFLTYGKKMTFRSIESIISEIDYVYKNYNISKFNFLDDNFLNINKFGFEFCKEINKLNFKIKWRYQARVDKISIEIIADFKNSGLFGMTLGLESGSPKILEAIKKGITIEQSEKAINICQKLNIPYFPNFIIGFPEETDNTINETNNFIKRNKIKDNIWINFIICYPKTKLYDYAIKNKIITNEDDYLSNLGPLGEKPYINISRWSDEELINKREFLLKSIQMRKAR